METLSMRLCRPAAVRYRGKTALIFVYPGELERVIAEYTGVAMVAVVGIPDETKGALSKPYVVPKLGIRQYLRDIVWRCRERLAAYKAPRSFQMVPELPRTSTGKILRRMLHLLNADDG
jgi:long-chain acyl-CoA synthetase